MGLRLVRLHHDDPIGVLEQFRIVAADQHQAFSASGPDHSPDLRSGRCIQKSCGFIKHFKGFVAQPGPQQPKTVNLAS